MENTIISSHIILKSLEYSNKIEVFIKGKITDDLLFEIGDKEVSKICFDVGTYDDLSMISKWLPDIKQLIIRGAVRDINSLLMCNELVHLNLATTIQGIDFSSFPKLKKLNVYYAKSLNSSISQLKNLKFLNCNNWIHEDLSLLRPMESLKELWMVDARKLKSLNGLEHNANLAKLQLDSANKLEDISTFNKLTNIEFLSLNGCKLITDYEPFKQLNKLSWLYLNKTGSISSLDFISEMKNLQHIVIRPEILDKDLHYLLELPNLRSFRFTKKAGYNLTKKQLSEHLITLWNGDIPEVDITPPM